MSWKLIANAERRLQGEIALLKPPAGGDVRVALGYPNTYHVGMSNLGLQLVYGLLNRMPGVSCERFFLPDPDEVEEFDRSGRRLFTLESQRPVSDFDLVAITCAYENDYVNLLAMLERAGLALFSKDRRPDDPLVVVGGAVTLLNPEPIADFVDVFCVGEAEGLLQPLVDAVRAGSGSRRERLETLSQVNGLYVPSLYTPIYENGVYKGLDPAPVIAKNYLNREEFEGHDTGSIILAQDTEFSNTYLIEVSRGCPYVCRFCTVGFSYPKVRWKPVDLIWKSVERVLEHNPRIGLISATVGNHPEIGRLCRLLMEHDLSVSFSSLRADKLPDEILETLVRGGSKSLTLAPETGSQDLRRSINKRFTDEQYFTAARRAFQHGIKNIKMYSMVGLPYEEDSDMDALIELVKATRRVQVEEGQGGGRITLGLGLFVPKPLTPYQWNAMAPLDLAERRMKRVQSGLAAVGGVKVNAETPRWAIMEGLLARADRRMGKVLARVYQRPTFKAYQKALLAEGLSLENELYRERSPEAPLPWGHIASSWPHERLLKDSVLARTQRRSGQELAG